MENNSTIYKVKYYDPYFEKDEISFLQDELSNLGPVRVRTFPKELGGDETNLWIIVQWIGVGYLGGIVQHIAARHYEKIINAIKSYRNRTQAAGIQYERAVMLVFSYDDLEINISLPNETNVTLLNEILEKVKDSLSKEPLRTAGVTQIFLPYLFDESEQLWRQTSDWGEVNYQIRFWGIQTDPFMYQSTWVNDIYDSVENRLVKAPTDNIFENIA